METTQIFDFILKIIWPVLLLVFLIICREAVSDFVKRLTTLRFKKGKTEVGIEASTPQIEKKDDQVKLLEQEPIAKNIKDAEIEEKEASEKDWFTQMHIAFDEGKVDDAKRIFKNYCDQEQNQENRDRNKKLYLYFLYSKGGDKGAINRLNLLAQNASSEKDKVDVLFWLSLCYRDSNNHKEEISLWENAQNEIKDSCQKTQCIKYLASALSNDGQSKRGLLLLKNRLQEVRLDEEKLVIFKAIADIEKELGNNLMSALCKEKVVELEPDNKDNLFTAAFAQSKASMRCLSICNYSTLLRLDRNNSWAFNNLGVCAAEYELLLKAFEYYKQAIDLDNTLAMANLGRKFLDSGLYEHAEEIANQGLKNENPHENIYSLLSKINKLKEEQSDKWSSIKEKSSAFQKNVRAYVDAYYYKQNNLDLFSGRWFTKKSVEINVSVDNTNLKTEWIDTAVGLLANKDKTSLSGNVNNASADVRYITSPSNTTRGLLDFSKDIDCLSYLEPNNASWYIFSKNIDDVFELRLYRELPNKDVE
jgi:tetratricopeptide (TPR) repeat protein